MSPSRRVISTRQVSRRVLGSANPLAKGFRDAGHGCADSFKGIFIGLLLFILAFIPTCYSTQVEKQSVALGDIPVISAADAMEQSGLVIIQDELDTRNIEPIELDLECGRINDYFDVFWYHSVLKEYTTETRTERRTETEIEDGQEVEVTYEDEVEEDSWETIEDSGNVVVDEFYLGDVKIDPVHARLMFPNADECDDQGREEVGEQWLTVDYLPIDDIDELLVVGNISHGEIDSGEPFIVTDLSRDALVASLDTEERQKSWTLTIISIVMFFLAFNLLIGPLLFLLKYVPIIGPGLRFVIGLISLVLAIVLVFLMRFILIAWWLILIVVVGLVVWGIMKRRKLDAAKVEEEPEEEVIYEEVEVEVLVCDKCGHQNELNSKFCEECGDDLTEELDRLSESE